MVQYSNKVGFNAYMALFFKISDTKWEVIAPEQLSNGTTDFIVNNLKKYTLDLSAGTLTEDTSFDVKTLAGLNTPVIPTRRALGYDFQNDEILIGVGEYDGSSSSLQSSTVKLLAIKRDFSSGTVLIDDVLTLAKNAASDATLIKYYFQCWGYGGKIACGVGTYADTSERSVILTYDGTSWSAIRANTNYDYIQEGIDLLWNGDTFIGWLTEGHGTNMHYISADLSTVKFTRPGGLFTLEPCYDPVNNKVWIGEWGSGTGATQNLWYCDPDPTSGIANCANATPSGSMSDNEGNSADLSQVFKANLAIVEGGYLMFMAKRGGWPEDGRTLAMTIQALPPGQPELVVDDQGSDMIAIWGVLRAIDPSLGKIVPIPAIVVHPSSS